MKKAIWSCAGLAALLAAVFTIACTGQKPTLYIYNWGDYLAVSVIEKFEKEFDCQVKMDAFDSNEAMYAKLKAGASGYDIAVPSSYMAALMRQQGMVADLDARLLPNVTKNIDRSYLKYALDRDMQYAVPYFASFTGIGYDKTKIKDFRPTWRMFERAELKNRCSLLNDMREVLGVALRTNGKSVNSVDPDDIAAAVALVMQWKQNIAKFEVDDAKRALASGEFTMIQTYSGDMLQVMSENENIAFAIPEEGSTFTLDNLVILKDCKNKELAHKFIDFIYRPEISAENMNEIMYTTPNTAAMQLVDKSLSENPAFNVPENIRQKCELMVDLGENNKIFVRAWEEIKQNEAE